MTDVADDPLRLFTCRWSGSPGPALGSAPPCIARSETRAAPTGPVRSLEWRSPLAGRTTSPLFCEQRPCVQRHPMSPSRGAIPRRDIVLTPYSSTKPVNFCLGRASPPEAKLAASAPRCRPRCGATSACSTRRGGHPPAAELRNRDARSASLQHGDDLRLPEPRAPHFAIPGSLASPPLLGLGEGTTLAPLRSLSADALLSALTPIPKRRREQLIRIYSVLRIPLK